MYILLLFAIKTLQTVEYCGDGSVYIKFHMKSDWKRQKKKLKEKKIFPRIFDTQTFLLSSQNC